MHIETKKIINTSSLFLFLIVLFVPFGVRAEFSPTRSLKIGSYGEDVRQLQVILNSDQETYVNLSGPGSKGYETAYFGPATERAVIRFQNKYASEVLIPLGLTQGTGFVGPSTAKKLAKIGIVVTKIVSNPYSPVSSTELAKLPYSEQIDIYATDNRINKIKESIINSVNTSLSSKTAPAIDFNSYSLGDLSLFIKDISAQQGLTGEKITLQGTGFDNRYNDVYFGKEYVLRGIPMVSGILTVSVPRIPVGKYDIAIKTPLGVSNTVNFVVRTATTPFVVVTGTSPDKISFGQQITVNGSGFTSSGNDVITNHGTFKNLPSSDGKTISFVFSPIDLSALAKMGNSGKNVLVSVDVVNGNGVSSETKYFNLGI